MLFVTHEARVTFFSDFLGLGSEATQERKLN